MVFPAVESISPCSLIVPEKTIYTLSVLFLCIVAVAEEIAKARSIRQGRLTITSQSVLYRSANGAVGTICCSIDGTSFIGNTRNSCCQILSDIVTKIETLETA